MSLKRESEVTQDRVRSIGRTISVWIALQCLFGLSVACGVVYWVTSLSFADSQLQLMAERRLQVEHVFSEPASAVTYEGLRHRLDDLLLGTRDIDLKVDDEDGGVLYDGSPVLSHQSVRVSTFSVPDPVRRGRTFEVQLTVDLSRDSNLLRAIAAALAIASVSGALVVSLGSLLLVRLGLQPLRSLVTELRRLDASSIDSRIDGSRQPVELQPLVTQFNALLSRLQTAYEQLEGFNADVAHELLTPLTTLIGSTEYALRRPRKETELREILGQNLEDLHRLNNIVQDMLFVSRADRGALARRTEHESLAGVVWKVIEFLRPSIEDAGLDVEVIGDTSCAVDEPLIERALSNLLSNGIRYARPNSTLTVSITSQWSEAGVLEVQLTVRNRGESIASGDLPRIFDRFYRADSSRTSSDRNHGLGLAIVAAIARMHQGRPVALRDAEGATIGLVLGMNVTQGIVKRTDTGG